MNIKNIAIAGLAVLALLFGYLSFSGKHLFGAVNPTGPQHFQMEAFLQGLAAGLRNQLTIDSSGNLSTTGTITSSAGALTSTAQTINGVTTTFSRLSSMTAATTTPCAILSPAATTTLESLVASITVGTSTAATLTFATSTTAFATTSLIAQKTVGANVGVIFDFHPAKDNSVISPSTYVVLGEQGGTGSFSNTGTCNAVFRSVN